MTLASSINAEKLHEANFEQLVQKGAKSLEIYISKSTETFKKFGKTLCSNQLAIKEISMTSFIYEIANSYIQSINTLTISISGQVTGNQAHLVARDLCVSKNIKLANNLLPITKLK